METLPEPHDRIKSLLSWFMSDEDVARYSDVAYALERLKTDELCWQAAVSIGVHALGWGVHGKTDEEKALADNLVDRALEPSEALHESLTRQAGQQPLTDEQGRMLFHVRFGLGFLLWVKGDQKRAKRALHDMAATKLSWSRGSHRSGGDIVPYTDDMGAGKELTALAMSLRYPLGEDYDEALYLIEQAADMPGRGYVPLVLADDLLDRWAAMCERIEPEGPWGPWLEWVALLYGVARILEVCSYVDTSDAHPAECDKASAQFFAYKFGQLAARAAAKNADPWGSYVEVDDEPGRWDLVVEALLCEHDPSRDWQKLRDRYLEEWTRTARYEGTSPEEIGPHMDLYWAMRIGFADKMLESTQAMVLSAEPVPTTSVVSDVEALMDTIRGMDRKLDELLTGSGQEVRGRVMRYLIAVSDVIAVKVLNHLEKAERYYNSKINDDIAKESFVKAVEATLNDCLVEPLIKFMQQHRQQQIDIPFPPPRGRERKGSAGIRQLKLWQWAYVLDTLVTPARRGLSPLATHDLRGFMDEHVGPRWPDFGPLAKSLRRVWELRGSCAHDQPAEARVDKELEELREMRELVLGAGGSPSVIVQIYRLLAPSKQPR
jgi:hypothetical protein